MTTLQHIAVHHSGGRGNDKYASTQHLSVADIDRAHKHRWNFRSQMLDHYAGYNFIIEKNGTVTQTRALGEMTAAQYGFNHNTISICVVGNFTKTPMGSPKGSIDTPTEEQKQALVELIEQLFYAREDDFVWMPGTTLDLSIYRIWPHRHFGNTECYGSALSDQWITDLVTAHFAVRITLLYKLLRLYQELINLRKSKNIAGPDYSCDGMM